MSTVPPLRNGIRQRSPSRKRLLRHLARFPLSLSAHEKLAEAYRKQITCVDAYRESVRLSMIRYDSGLSNYLEIIDAQIQLYPAETATVTYDLGRKIALVNLYRALGGGWNLTDAQWTSSNVPPAAKPAPAP